MSMEKCFGVVGALLIATYLLICVDKAWHQQEAYRACHQAGFDRGVVVYHGWRCTTERLIPR